MPASPEDSDEIRQLIARYCLHFDAHEATEWASLFTPDGVFELGPVRAEGTDALEKFAASASTDTVVRHIATNVVIDVTGDEARSESYLIILRPAAESPISMVARYEDRLRRIDGRWRFSERRVIPDPKPPA